MLMAQSTNSFKSSRIGICSLRTVGNAMYSAPVMDSTVCVCMFNQKERKHISTFFSVPSFLTYQDFNKFRQEDMIRMTKVPTTPTPSTTKPFPSHTSRCKTRPVFSSQHVDIFDESNCDSTETTLLDKDESDPFPSPAVKSASNLLGTKRTCSRVQFTFPKDSEKIIIEEHKDVKVIPSTQHSTIGRYQGIPQPKPVLSPDFCPSPEKPSQDVDKSHLSDSTSTTHSLNDTCSLDTSGDHLPHLNSPSLSSELQTPQVLNLNLFLILRTYFNWILPVFHLKTHPEMKLNLNLKDNWTMSTLHQQMFSVINMTKNCSYYKRRLMHHLTISVIRKAMLAKS